MSITASKSFPSSWSPFERDFFLKKIIPSELRRVVNFKSEFDMGRLFIETTFPFPVTM